MAKFIQAESLLKEKNYVQPKFNSSLFMNIVTEYFRKRDVSAILHIVSARFIGNNLFTDEDRANGFTPLRFGDDYVRIKQIGVEVPEIYRDTIVVDEPYLKNAVFTLENLCGFIVKKQKYIYKISLV